MRRGLLVTAGAWLGLAAAGAAHAAETPDGRVQDLRLVAIGTRDGVRVAYLLEADGDVLEVKSGDRLLAGEVVDVGAETLEFREPAGKGPGAKPAGGRLKLFASRGPSDLAIDRGEYTGHAFSVDLDCDIQSAAIVFARFSGMNVALEAGTSGPVRIAARNAPWDGLLAQALKTGGFGYRIDRTYVRVARADRVAAMRAIPEREYSGEPISLLLRDAAIEDLARVFEQVGGTSIRVPPGSHPRLTLWLDTVRSDEALELVLAAMGWTSHLEGRTVVVDVPAKAR